MNQFSEMASKISHDVAKATEKEITSQLNDLISRGILIVETQGPTLVQDQFSSNPYEVKVQTAVRLRFKGQEYVEELEKKIEKLVEWKAKIQDLIGEDLYK